MVNLSSYDSSLIQKSANLLCNELKTPVKVEAALKGDILNALTKLLNDFSSFLSETLVCDLLVLLQVMSTNFYASLKISGDEALMKTILSAMGAEVDKKISLEASKCVLSLSLNPLGCENEFSTFQLQKKYSIWIFQLPTAFFTTTIISCKQLSKW